MDTDIKNIDKLINSIRFQAEVYGIDRTITPPHGLEKTQKEIVISAKQTFVDLKVLLLRLENALWPGSENGISNQTETADPSGVSSEN